MIQSYMPCSAWHACNVASANAPLHDAGCSALTNVYIAELLNSLWATTDIRQMIYFVQSQVELKHLTAVDDAAVAAEYASSG